MQYDIISVRSTRAPYKVTKPADVYTALKRYATSKVEKFFAISLDGQHAILHINMVSIGTTNRCMAVPRDIFHAAIKDRATALVVAHCHPSGNNSPSEEDRVISNRLREVGEIIGIPVLDSLTFSRTGYYSFVEGGLLVPTYSD
ncbi:MAG: JAB domain-containing protein [bacterium]|jgi:DNA repair protein RadC